MRPRRHVVTVDRPDLNGLLSRDFDRIEALPPETQVRHSDQTVEVYFSNLEEHLCRLIRASNMVVGCVAWLTSVPVLKALAGCEAVSIILQKEEFLRPDLSPQDGWRDRLRDLYDKLPGGVDLDSFDFRFTNVDCALHVDGGFKLDAVRCCGIVDKSSSVVPRMHHKFMVFFRRLPDDHPLCVERGHSWCLPVAVWTGSFNPSANGTRSLENAVLIIPQWVPDLLVGTLSEQGYGQAVLGEITTQYVEEWARVLSISESLEWNSRDVTPEIQE